MEWRTMVKEVGTRTAIANLHKHTHAHNVVFNSTVLTTKNVSTNT